MSAETREKAVQFDIVVNPHVPKDAIGFVRHDGSLAGAIVGIKTQPSDAEQIAALSDDAKIAALQFAGYERCQPCGGWFLDQRCMTLAAAYAHLVASQQETT